jgi:cytochrome bd-type quinol oxidase subunit 2
MRRWGVVLSVFYAVIVLGILIPWAMLLSGESQYGVSGFLKDLREIYREGMVWVFTLMVVVSQAFLLFLSVDTTQKRLKPQAHIWVSCAVASALTALMAYGAVLCVGVAMRGDKFLDANEAAIGSRAKVLIGVGILWALWAVAFYLYLRNKSEVVSRVVSWLLRGSVLELLIAVPCHVLVRRKHECCAPLVTSFGIVTGVAIMLLSFGPSILFLYKKRLDGYAMREGK